MLIEGFENRLNSFLNDSAMSKNALAKTLEMSQSQVSNLANGKCKRWTKNTKKIDDFIEKYYRNNFKIPKEIEATLKEILVKNPENKVHILQVLKGIKSLKLEAKK